MKVILLISACLVFIIGCNSKKLQSNNDTLSSKTIFDINADGRADSPVIVKKLSTLEDTLLIVFANHTTDTLLLSGSDAEIQLLDDLNGDGANELGVMVSGSIGCWWTYHTFSFSRNKWTALINPFPIHCSHWQPKEKWVFKDAAHHNTLYYKQSTDSAENIIVQLKSITIH